MMGREYIYKEKTLKAVDLGLSVLWANRNIGSIVPASYGKYYSWGDLFPWRCESSYQLGELEKKITSISGYPSFDIAAQESEKVWRIPTASEFEELISRCRWIWVDEDKKRDCLCYMVNYSYYFASYHQRDFARFNTRRKYIPAIACQAYK